MRITAALFLFSLCNGIFGDRILVIPAQGKSHMVSVNSLGQEMKSRGHEVYTVAEEIFKGRDKQIGAAGLEVVHYKVQEGTHSFESQETEDNLIQMILTETLDVLLPSQCIYDSCRNMLEDKEFMKTITSLKFDLAVVETHFVPCSNLLPHILKIPFVTFMPGFFRTFVEGSVDMPSYQPSLLFEPQSVPMSFTDRLKNTLYYILLSREIAPSFLYYTGIMPSLGDTSLIEEYKEKGLVSKHINNWFDLQSQTQLYLVVNSDLTFDYPKPLFPNVISLEGLSAAEAKPLSKDLENQVQSAKHGIIIVSFGSNIQHLPDELVIKMVNAFGKRKELFLMRFSRALQGKNFVMPSNVKFMSWLPQNDLLAHEKTKLFITHGGLYGLHEAVYQGVPMLCVPLFGDQPSNAKKLKAKGFGLYFRLMSFTEDEVSEKIEEIVSNPSYRERTKRAGQIMRHKPMNARQTAAFWIEHVLQFGGEHLKPSSIELTWWQFYCLDTLGTLASVLIFVVFVLCTITRLILKCLFGSKSHQKKD